MYRGDFWVYLGGDRFSRRFGKIRRNKKFGRFNVVLKLEFEVKTSDGHLKTVPYQPGVLLGGVNCLVVFQNYFSFFYSLFKPLTISFNFMFTPTLTISQFEV